MKTDFPSVLTINGGSLSIKFAIYQKGDELKRGVHEKVDRIGVSGTNLTFRNSDGEQRTTHSLDTSDQKVAVQFLLDWLKGQEGFASVRAIRHRVVHPRPHLRRVELPRHRTG